MVSKALSCITSRLDSINDTYATALVTYTLVLANHSEASKIMKSLRDKAVKKGNIWTHICSCLSSCSLLRFLSPVAVPLCFLSMLPFFACIVVDVFPKCFKHRKYWLVRADFPHENIPWLAHTGYHNYLYTLDQITI